MVKLKTSYLGLNLKSPLIVSSSRLTSNIGNIIESEENGAGAVVLKSLFEEQISYTINQLSTSSYPEADDYISSYSKSHSIEKYLELIRSAKRTVKIPVIASINCYTSESWLDFASKIADAGADALEVNIFFMPSDRKVTSPECEKEYFRLAEDLRKRVKIPMAIKLGMRFTNILYIIDQLYIRGYEGVVLFNRFYEPDIDITKLEITPASVFSSENEMRYVLRSVAMASGQDIKIDISASTGVRSGADAIKYLLAGAKTVQLCSVLYSEGLKILRNMNTQIEEWMGEKNFDSINEFRGKLNIRNYERPMVWERTQFMKYFSSEE